MKVRGGDVQVVDRVRGALTEACASTKSGNVLHLWEVMLERMDDVLEVEAQAAPSSSASSIDSPTLSA